MTSFIEALCSDNQGFFWTPERSSMEAGWTGGRIKPYHNTYFIFNAKPMNNEHLQSFDSDFLFSVSIFWFLCLSHCRFLWASGVCVHLCVCSSWVIPQWLSTPFSLMSPYLHVKSRTTFLKTIKRFSFRIEENILRKQNKRLRAAIFLDFVSSEFCWKCQFESQKKLYKSQIRLVD